MILIWVPKPIRFNKECAEWANLLETQAFVTVPFTHDGTIGRLFLSTNTGWFTFADIHFLAHAADIMATVMRTCA